MLVNCKVLFKYKPFLSLFFRGEKKHLTERMGCDFLHHGMTEVVRDLICDSNEKQGNE